MAPVVITYVKFFFGGLSTLPPIQVQNRDMSQLHIPPGALGCCFYDVVAFTFLHQGTKHRSESRINQSPNYYFGYLCTAEELSQVSGGLHLQRQLVECGSDQVMLLVNGAWVPFDPDEDEVVPPQLVGLESPAWGYKLAPD
jgi:hypothetical protein